MSIVNKTDIQNYAKRNTSPKMGIEQLYLQAFIDSMLNSTSLNDKVKNLMQTMQNGDSFMLFNSIDASAKTLNKEPYRSIIAYAMLKKDFRLFELISASMFTGTVVAYYGDDLYTDIVRETDETPMKYTDSGTYTDMSTGRVRIGFKNIFTTNILEDGTGSEYQTLEELKKSLEDFDPLITLTKPARVGIFLFYEPYCFITGDKSELKYINMNIKTSPFMDEESMGILDNMSDVELLALYKVATHVKYLDDENVISRTIDTTRSIKREKGFISFIYEFRTMATSAEENIWDWIIIQSNIGNHTYMKTDWKGPETAKVAYYEKYDPVMLRLEDNDPDGPCLALQIENGTPTVGAMFYVRDPKGGF